MKTRLFLFTILLIVISISFSIAQTAYIPSVNNNCVTLIDIATNNVAGNIAVGNFPYGVSPSPDGSKVYVANEGYNKISVINTLTNIVTDSIIVGHSPVSLGNFISTYTQPNGIAILNNQEATITIAPNPFTSETTITFSEEQTHTIIKVRNILGEEIKTLVISAANQITLEKGTMQAGIYFLEITDSSTSAGSVNAASSPTRKNVVNKKVVVQ